MNEIIKKINNISGNKLFFVGYLFFFAVSLFLCANADIIVPSKVVDTSYKVLRASDYPLIRLCLIGIAVIHFAGGAVFFYRLVIDKINQ